MMEDHPGHHVHQSEHGAEANWSHYWEKHSISAAWSAMAELVLNVLKAEAGPFEGRRILEAGAGSGRISMRLAVMGASVAAIDTAPQAVKHIRDAFEAEGRKAEVREGSIFAIPFPDAAFDVVWNAGVLEHFTPEEQALSLREMSRVCRPGGLVLTLNPYRFALFYRFGKWLAESLGLWPYGFEQPVTSIAAVAPGETLSPVREYSTGFFIVLVQAFRIFSFTTPATLWLSDGLLRGAESPLRNTLHGLDRFFSRLLGGYLLVSCFRKADSERAS